MGLIQVPRGIQTKRGYAPADIARSAAESAAPWAWREHLFSFLPAVGIGLYPRFVAPAIKREAAQIGVGPLGTTLRLPIRSSGYALQFDPNPLQGKDLQSKPFTIFASGYIDNQSESAGTEAGIVGTTRLGGKPIALANGTLDGWISAAVFGENFDAFTFDRPSEYKIVMRVDTSKNVEIWWNGELRDSRTITGSVTTVPSDSDLHIGHFDSDVATRLDIVRWHDAYATDDEIALFFDDPFAPFRRRPLLMPVSVSTGESVTVQEGSLGGDAWTAIATAPSALTEAAQAADTYSAIATVGASLVEAVAAQDTNGSPASALEALTEPAAATDLATATAQVSAAITAGAAAGESWVAQAQAVAELVEAGAAADTITQGASSAEQAAIDEGSAAGDAFAAAIQAIASLTEAADAADALVATVTAMVTLTESAAAGSQWTASTEALAQATLTSLAAATDTYSTVGQVLAALQESITAGAVYTAAASVTAAIAEGAIAGDSWSAVVPGTGYLVASAITITAALSGTPSTRPAVTGKPSFKPQE